MSCHGNDINKKPKRTQNMIDNNKVFIWNNIKNNPNLYCWIPVSEKNVVTENIPFEKVSIQDIPLSKNIENFKNTVQKAEKHLEKIRQRNLRDGSDPISGDDKKKYKIVSQFIKDRQLVLYGGTVINMYLPREAKIYKSGDTPDYDMYSYKPWEDAVDLVDLLYQNGFEYTEARAGVHPGTYKVFSNFIPVADITYMSKEDLNKLQTSKIRGIKVVSSYNIISEMYKQLLTINDTHRWEKVGPRLKLMEKYKNPVDKRLKCSSDIFINEEVILDENLTKLLEQTFLYCKKNKLLHTGPLAYNTYIEIGGGLKRLLVDHYEVLTENGKQNAEELFDILIKTGVNKNSLSIITKYETWKSLNHTSYSILFNSQLICKFIQLSICVGYKYILQRYIVSIDYLKYELYEKLAFTKKEDNSDLNCLLKYLYYIQNNFYKKKNKTELDNTPFQRFILNCKGPVKSSLKNKFLENWINRIENKDKIRQLKPESNKIILNNVKNKVIRIFDREEIPENCRDKNKNDCNFPCYWDKKEQRCFDKPFGTYQSNRKNVADYEDVEDVEESSDENYYPVYG